MRARRTFCTGPREFSSSADRAAHGTVASRFRMKCTRHRCQVVPARTVLIAVFSPSWASEMTSAPPSVRV
jgi:hypothetical protein